MAGVMTSDDSLRIDAAAGAYVPIERAAERGGVALAALPYACRVFVENLERGRLCDPNIGAGAVAAMLHWRDNHGVGVPLTVGRVILPDSSGLPVLLDLASLRDAVAANFRALIAGWDASRVETSQDITEGAAA